MRAVCGYCDKDATEKGQCDCADSLKDQMALLKRLLREYRQDHNDREDDAAEGRVVFSGPQFDSQTSEKLRADLERARAGAAALREALEPFLSCPHTATYVAEGKHAAHGFCGTCSDQYFAASAALATDAGAALLTKLRRAEAGAAALREALEDAVNEIRNMATESDAGFSCSVIDAADAALATDAGAALLERLRRAEEDAARLADFSVKAMSVGRNGALLLAAQSLHRAWRRAHDDHSFEYAAAEELRQERDALRAEVELLKAALAATK